jgi:hypothetical protein
LQKYLLKKVINICKTIQKTKRIQSKKKGQKDSKQEKRRKKIQTKENDKYLQKTTKHIFKLNLPNHA